MVEFTRHLPGKLTREDEEAICENLYKIQCGQSTLYPLDSLPPMPDTFKDSLVTPAMPYKNMKTRGIKLWWTHEGP